VIKSIHATKQTKVVVKKRVRRREKMNTSVLALLDTNSMMMERNATRFTHVTEKTKRLATKFATSLVINMNVPVTKTSNSETTKRLVKNFIHATRNQMEVVVTHVTRKETNLHANAQRDTR